MESAVPLDRVVHLCFSTSHRADWGASPVVRGTKEEGRQL